MSREHRAAGASGGSHFEERLPTALVPLSDPSPLGVVAGVLELALALLDAVAQLSRIELGRRTSPPDQQHHTISGDLHISLRLSEAHDLRRGLVPPQLGGF